MGAPIGVVLGSFNDVKRMKPGLDRLNAMGVPFEILVASAHRTPAKLTEWLEGAEERGVRVIIAGAGAAAHLPGVVASKTLLPVIGVPFNASPLQGTDALYSIVQMPPGIPVATVGIESAENAAVLALHILALSDAEIRHKLVAFRADWVAKIEEQNKKLYEEYPESRPALNSAPLEKLELKPHAHHAHHAHSEPHADSISKHLSHASFASTPKPKRAGSGGVCKRVNCDHPEVSVIEEAADVLLDGGIVALPTDTVYGLAVDATNPDAVRKLFSLKGRDEQKPVAVLIDSFKMLENLLVEVPPRIRDLLDMHWPGPLTVVGRKREAALRAVSRDQSLGLRMPNNMVALSVISMLARPVAASSANFSGEPPLESPRDIAKRFGTEVDLVLDTGLAGDSGSSTVLNIMSQPYRILREGPLSRAALRETLGDLLE